MPLVGPPSAIPNEVEHLTALATAPPTDAAGTNTPPAEITSIRGLDDNRHYIDDRSLALDWKIPLRTVSRTLRGRDPN